MNLICLLIGYVIGVLVSAFILQPGKAFREGYEKAKSQYSDWKDGFNCGWDNGIEAMGRIAQAWKQRERKEE